MTKILPHCSQEGPRSRKRRLQNPKIEKAEILDLAVEYLHKWTSGANDAAKIRHAAAVEVSPPHLEPSPIVTMESAGFKRCIADLTGYMHKITPAQRSSLIEGLRRHTEGQPPPSNGELEQRLGQMPQAYLDSSYSSDKKEESLKFPFLSHSFNHSPHCSTPLHDYLSPPHSPWFSPLSSYSTSPPFVTYACHFTFPPTPSSCNSGLASLPAAVAFTPTSGLCLPLQLPPQGASSGFAPLWRPW
uniref:Uncharacterized protein n=1 Tax=Knipowitschia caucasica TaxID=637954 RepID=A0AAV2MLG3_KNICA